MTETVLPDHFETLSRLFSGQGEILSLPPRCSINALRLLGLQHEMEPTAHLQPGSVHELVTCVIKPLGSCPLRLLIRARLLSRQ